MTPDQERKLNEVYEFMQARKRQAIPYPLDDASRVSLKVAQDGGAGSIDLTETLNLTGNAQNIDVPAPFDGSRIIRLGNAQFIIPYYNV